MNHPVPDKKSLPLYRGGKSTIGLFGRGAALAVTVMSIILLLLTAGAFAGGSLEGSMQDDLGEVRALAARAIEKMDSGASAETEIAGIKERLEGMKATHLLMKDRFAKRGEKAKGKGAKAQSRQSALEERYTKSLDNIIEGMENVPAKGWGQKRKLKSLKEALDKGVRKRKYPIHGALPYRNLNLPAKKPVSEPVIIPAYRGGNTETAAADLQSTDEAPVSKEIAGLAESLHWNPVEIYEYVKNNVETEWYYGCMKGAEETARLKSGNDCDQAALLVALLRASSFPARYVTGMMEFFGGVEQAKNLTGIEDPMKIAQFFQKAGIPYEPVIAGGKIVNYRLEHIWVEAYIPYSNYRGAVIDGLGKTWLALDTSIKALGYDYAGSKDLLSELSANGGSLAGMRDEYLASDWGLSQDYGQDGVDSGLSLSTPLGFIKNRLSSDGYDLAGYMKSGTLNEEVLNIIPAGLQFSEAAITGESAALPEQLLHRVSFAAKDGLEEIMRVTLPLHSLVGRRIAVTYEPETVDDQEIINAWAGLDNTPAYLVHLRPVITIDGERAAVASGGLAMGSDYELTVELVSPNGTNSVTNTHTTGNLSVIGIGTGSNIPSPPVGEGEGEGAKNAEQLLYEEAMSYISRWTGAEDEFASLLNLAVARPLPTVVTLGGVIDVTYLLDTPHGFEWKGVFMDADFRSIEVIPSPLGGEGQGEGERKKLFMQLASLQGSILENRIFEDDFKVDSISTAKLMQLAKSNAVSILTINAANIDTILPTLPFDDYIKEEITNSVNQGLTVTIPQSEVSYMDWNGLGWIKENSQTGESGWMLTGMIAGGMTSVMKEKWKTDDIADVLSLPYTGAPNTDPASVVKLVRINKKDGDYQQKTAGTKLKNQFTVIALDSDNRQVQGVEVTFEAIEGGGSLEVDDGSGNIVSGQEVRVTTGADGLASATLTLGQKTEDSPYYIQGTPNWQLVGLNLVSVSTGSIYTDKPFEAYGLPGDATKIIKLYGDGATGYPNTMSGTLVAKVADALDNPVANKTVTFNVESQTFLGTHPVEGAEVKNAKLFSKPDDCPGVASLGCVNANQAIEYISDSVGEAYSYVILGNTENTEYNISAKVFEALEGEEPTELLAAPDGFRHSSLKLKEDGQSMAEPQLIIASAFSTDADGNTINAGLPGSTLASPITVNLRYVMEDYEVVGGSNLEGKGTFITLPADYGKVEFTPLLGGGSVTPATVENGTDGKYSTVPTLGTEPALNFIKATATITIPEPYIDETGGLATREKELWGNTGFNIWGVRASLKPLYIFINEEGYPVEDTAFTYSVEPPTEADQSTYTPRDITLRVYEKDEDGNEALIALMEPNQEKKLIISQGGIKFRQGYDYSAEIVMNYGTGNEIRSGRVGVEFSSLWIEKHDSEFPYLRLRWNDYYPALGAKTITLKGLGNSIEGATLNCKVLSPLPTALGDGTIVCTPLTDGKINAGKVEFKLSAQKLPIDISQIELMFYLGAEAAPTEKVNALYNIKNNSNTNLAEVLKGEAVFTYDKSHKGETTGKDNKGREFDFVQKMINHIVPPLRTPVKEANLENTLKVDGYYGDDAKAAIKGIINGGAFTIDAKTFTLVTSIKVSHHTSDADKNNGAYMTFAKLAKDYSGLETADIGKVIDKELLVGLKKDFDKDKHPTADNDIGIYELYMNDDWDGDGISNYVEVENNINPLVTNSGYADPDNPLFSVERGGRGNRLEKQGLLESGLRIANVNKGYYYFRSHDPIDDLDNYGALRALNALERVGRAWEAKYPDLYPMKKDMFVRNGAPFSGEGSTDLDDNDDDDKNGLENATPNETRFGIGDISLEGGGPFYKILDKSGTLSTTETDHKLHQNGLGVDIRFIRNNNTEGVVDMTIDSPTEDLFSEELTIDLINLLFDYGAFRVYVARATGIEQSKTNPNRQIIHQSDHYNHLHADFPIVNTPVGNITLTPSASSISADGVSTIIINVDGRDTYGYPLVAVTASTSSGNIVVGNNESQSRNVSLDANENISFQLRAGTMPGQATVTVTSIPVGNEGQITISGQITINVTPVVNE